jgi:DNA replication licensing factor MCM7
MALLTTTAPVNYEEQEGLCTLPQKTVRAPQLTAHAGAFVDFLKTFKSSSTEAADQLESLTLNGGGDEADEYDMVDDSDDPAPNGTQTRNKSKLKYMNLLQDVANRVQDEIRIDLNDIEAVGCRV